MTVTEESRHRLHLALDRTLGEEDATTLMEHLPPVGWSDVATKQDLAHLEERLALRFDVLDERFARVDHQFALVDQQFELVRTEIRGVAKEVSGLGTRIAESDRRYEVLMARVDHFFWHVIALLGTIGLILIGVAQIRGR